MTLRLQSNGAMRSSTRSMPVRYVQSGPRSTAHRSSRPRSNGMQRAWPISSLHRRAESSSPEPRWPACPAAETLRDLGYDGALVLVGDEPHPPYDRPPLSKQVLTRRLSTDTALPQRRDLDIDWRLGVAARGVDLIGRRLELANGDALDYDRLLIATGTRARPWPKP